MNQRIIIYIILSAILLYLYYKKRDISVFAAFIVVVSSTLIFGKDVREGAKNKGGGGGIDKECTKMGFKKPKIDKDDPEGSIEKILKNIKKVADKYWPYDSNTPNEEKVSLGTFIKEFQNDAKTFDDNERKKLDIFILTAADAYEKKKTKELLEQTPANIVIMISGGELTLKILKSVIKSTKTDSEFKERMKYLICLCKQWTAIFKEIKKANGDGDAGDGDEEEKPKKKKNAKKAKKEEDDDAGDEEEKPKKKKKAKKEEDPDDNEE